MKLSKRIIQQFNSPDTILVLSKYPYQDIAHSYHGVARYTQRTLSAVAKTSNQRFVVFVQHEYNREPQLLERGRVLVIPAFSANKNMYFEILRMLRVFNKPIHLHIHSEYFTSGNVLQMTFALPFYLSLKAAGYFLSYFAHNVISDFNFLARHLGKSHTSRTMRSIESLLPLYYWFLGLSLNQVICLDESMRDRLAPFISRQKLIVSPHWIFPKTAHSRQSLRKKMGYTPDDLVLVCFGFMTRYKGVDWLVDAVKDIAADQLGTKQLKLILAGGKAPSQSGKSHYEQFYRSLQTVSQHSGNIVLTEFIPDSELECYFAVADLLVLPYRGILGASGSWSEGLAYSKPFILSHDLAAYLENTDAKRLLAKHNIRLRYLLFRRNKRSFVEHLRMLSKPAIRRKIAAFAKELAFQRSPAVRLQEELVTIYTSNPSRNNLEWQYVGRLKKLIPIFAS